MTDGDASGGVNKPVAADVREARADERDRVADRREAIADERERLADQRELLADKREEAVNNLQARVDARARNLGVPTETTDERVLETITRGRALLADSLASLDRSEAAIERARERRTSDQASVDLETEASRRELTRRPDQPDTPEAS